MPPAARPAASSSPSPLPAPSTVSPSSPAPPPTRTPPAPATGASVLFTDGNTALTNALGQTLKTVTANGTAGTYSVTASAPNLAIPATFTLTNNGPAGITATSGGGQTTTITTRFQNP